MEVLLKTIIESKSISALNALMTLLTKLVTEKAYGESHVGVVWEVMRVLDDFARTVSRQIENLLSTGEKMVILYLEDINCLWEDKELWAKDNNFEGFLLYRLNMAPDADPTCPSTLAYGLAFFSDGSILIREYPDPHSMKKIDRWVSSVVATDLVVTFLVAEATRGMAESQAPQLAKVRAALKLFQGESTTE